MKKGITMTVGILVVMLVFGGMAYGKDKTGQGSQQGQIQGQSQGQGQMQSQQLGPKKINLNTATSQELQRVPGLNQNLAQNIIDYRVANGPYGSVDDLSKIQGLDKQKIQTLQQSLMVKYNLNTVTAQELMRVPGVNQTLAQNIVRYREANGPFQSMDDLNRVSGIDDYRMDLLKKYIQIG